MSKLWQRRADYRKRPYSSTKQRRQPFRIDYIVSRRVRRRARHS